MRRAVLSLAAAALSASRPACAFAPSTQVRGRAQQLPLGVAGTSLGGLAPPSGKPHAASRSGQTQTAAAAGTLLPADAAWKQQEAYDDTEYFDGFMSRVLDKVNEREDSELWRAAAKKRGIAQLMDTIVTIAACMMAMQFFGMWMALGVWAWRRASDFVKSTSAAATSAQALFVAFASGSPLDRASRENVLNRAGGQRKAQDGPVLTLRHADGSAVREAVETGDPKSSSVAWAAYKARQAQRATGAQSRGESGSATIMGALCEPADALREAELRKEREEEARRMRSEMLQLTKDIAFIANYHARRAAVLGAQKVTQVATSPDTRRAMMAAAGFVATTGIVSSVLDKLSASAHS